MHSGVAILVKDMARQEVFQSRPVSCLSRAMLDLFGPDIMKELDSAKENLRLHGFLSKTSHVLSSKTLQLFCILSEWTTCGIIQPCVSALLFINRRFLHKTLIHKLLNSASNCGLGMNPQGTHRKWQAFPAFVKVS